MKYKDQLYYVSLAAVIIIAALIFAFTDYFSLNLAIGLLSFSLLAFFIFSYLNRKQNATKKRPIVGIILFFLSVSYLAYILLWYRKT